MSLWQTITEKISHKRDDNKSRPVDYEIVETTINNVKDGTLFSVKPINGPKEELFLPLKYNPASEENKLGYDGHEFSGITYRVHSTGLQTTVLPGMPSQFTGMTYDTEQFRVGLSNGYAGIPPTYNLETQQRIQTVDKSLSFPLRPGEKIAKAEAKKIWVDLEIATRNRALQELMVAQEELKPRLKELQAQRQKRVDDEIEYENRLIQNTREEKQVRREEPREMEPSDEEIGRQNVFVKLVTGSFLLLCGLIFLLADVALSIAAIYALGFNDIAGIRWAETIFNPSYWKTHWEGISVCLGIAGITVFFKYAYERLVHSTTPLKRFETVLFPVLTMICLTTVCFLGILRANYLLNNVAASLAPVTQNSTPVSQDSTKATPQKQPEQQTFFGVNRNIAFWSMFLTTILFPILGAVALSEGLNRTFGSLGWMLHKTTQPLGRIGEKVTTAMQRSAPETLDKEIERTEGKLKELDHEKRRLEQEIHLGEKEKHQIVESILVWQRALQEYSTRWEAMARLEQLLYIHGYELGRILRGRQGAYKIISGMLANELTRRAENTPIALNGKLQKENVLDPYDHKEPA